MARADAVILVEVVYATPDEQRLYRVRVPRGATVRLAVEESGVIRDHPDIDLDAFPLGTFGERADATAEVRAGDRIEIYRPLIADAKETRRRRAAGRAKR